MRVHVRFPPPHGNIQRQIFNSHSTKNLLEMWVACGTKFGKTISGTVSIGRGLIGKRQGLFRWVAPTYGQSLIGKRNLSRILPPEPYVIPLQYTLKVPGLDSTLEFRSGDKPENLEGEACHGYVLDECAKMRPLVYASAKTTVTLTRGPILAISTPRGKNWFHKKCVEAEEQMKWEMAKGVPVTKVFLTAPTDANPRISKKIIEDARKSLPDRLFRQYYLAEFVDDGSTFAGFRDCYYTDLIEIYESRQFWKHEAAAESTVVVGVDWAKSVDWTVFIAIDIATRRVVAFERFHKRPYTEAIRQLVRFVRNFHETAVVWHDRTGVGEAIDDQLAYTNLPFQGIVFTNSSKSNMVTKLITSVETKGIGLPRWNVLDLEMDAYEVSTTEIGTVTYSAAEGYHDDTVSALMLANAALHEYAERDMDIRFLEELTSDKNIDRVEPGSLEAYYNDLAEDED